MLRDRKKVGNDIYGVNSDWKLRWRMGESAETGFRHNDHYHKYFHGYTEVRIEKENGKYRIERYYTDDWYVQDVSDRKWIVWKFLLLALSVFSTACYFWLMSRPDLEGNTSRIVAIPGLISVPLLILLLASAIGYVFTKRKMTWWEHHASTERIMRYTLITGTMLLLTGLLLLFQILGGVERPAAEAKLALGVIGTALAPFLMYYLERSINYRTEKNEVELPVGENHLIM